MIVRPPTPHNPTPPQSVIMINPGIAQSCD
jgi:hypothetical protein